MFVLNISTDEKIFNKESGVCKRMEEYGKLFDGLFLVVFTGQGFKSFDLGNNVKIYPTNSFFKLFSPFLAYKIASRILKRNYGKNWIITTQDPFETGMVGWFLKIRYKIPFQVQIHTDFLSRFFWKESLKNKIRVLIGKFIIKRADRIRVVSERIKNSLFKNYKVDVLPIFVDVDKIKISPIKADLHKKYKNYDFIILMASRLTREKNVGLAIEVTKGILRRYPKTLLLIVGEGPEREALESRIKNYELSRNVKIERWQGNLISYYKTADLFLLTSNYEGYGRTIIEAMAGGLPVVITDVGLAGEIVKDGKNGRVAPVYNKILLEKAILDLIENRQERERLIRNGQETINKLGSKEEYLERYREKLEKICRM